MFKKTQRSILLIFVLALGLTACGGQTESEPAVVEAEQPTVVVEVEKPTTVVEAEESVVAPEVEESISSVAADGTTYVVDTAVSTIGWYGDKIVGDAHNGTVDLSEGTLIVEGGALVSGSFVIDMTTIANENLSGNSATRLVNHLMAEDFFGVDVYPTATLDILTTESLGDNQYAVIGNLTIKEIRNPIEFVAEAVAENGVITATADIEFDRTLYDVVYKSGSIFSGLGDEAINDEVQITVTLVANS